MQFVIEDVVRWFGFAVLKAFTLGRYRGGRSSDQLAEGAIGLAVIAGTTYIAVIGLR